MHELNPEQTPLEAAQNTTPETADVEICAIIAAASEQSDDVTEILATLEKRINVAHYHLLVVERQIRSHRELKRAGPAEALALDVMRERFAYGTTLMRTADGQLIFYAGTHWTPISDVALRAILRPLALKSPDRYGPSAQSVSAALSMIRDLAPAADEMMRAKPQPVVNVQNAELWIEPGGGLSRRVHRSQDGLQYVLPIAYDPEATCPQFDKMIHEVFGAAKDPADMVRHLSELIGYALQPVRDIPVIAFLWGGGANGKSTILSILQAVIGQDQVYAGSLSALTNDKFTLPNLLGKLLIVEDDAKDGERLNDGVLKKIAENKLINTRRVRSTHGLTFRSMAMPLIAINGAPMLDDTSHGISRRLQVIPFERRFTKAEINPQLATQIIETELPGVLNWMLNGLCALRARGAFDPPAECEVAKARFLCASNPLHAFIDERCDLVADGRTSIADVWMGLISWCKAQGQRIPFTRRSLRDRLNALGYVVRKSNVMVVDGLVLRASE
jgi:P4 family phage/plasmid primase-like protien